MFTRIVARLSIILSEFSKLFIFLIMIIGIASIILRKVGYPFPGDDVKLNTFLFISAVYFSFPFVQLKKQHIFVEVLVGKFRGKTRFLFQLTSVLLSFVGAIFMAWASWPYTFESLRRLECMEGYPFYPIYPAKLCVSVGLSVLALQLFVDSLGEVKSTFRKK